MRRVLPFPIVVAASLVLLLSGCAIPRDTPTAATDRAVAAKAQEGAIELDWQRPEDRMNGAPLGPTEIAGYRIYLGDAPDRYTRTIDVKDPTQTRYLLRGLEAGKEYYVAITTIDSAGRESPKSEDVALAAAPLTDTQFAESDPDGENSQRASID
jgi:fibronectin type 3 domain-containing protein